MPHIEELFFDGMVVAELDMHPDDYLPHGNAHHAMNNWGPRIKARHNVTATTGSNTTKDYHPQWSFNIRRGDRAAEGELGAKIMGFDTYTQWDATDAAVWKDKAWLVHRFADFIMDQEVDLVLGPNRFGVHDSPDHRVGAAITLAAARIAHEQTGRTVRVLIPQVDGTGGWVAPSTPESQALIHEAAEANASQFRYGDPAEFPGWDHVASGRSMHPKDHGELSQYPIDSPATYQLHVFGNLTVAQAVELSFAAIG